MPLFGKKKADSDKAKDQKKANKKVQDRFMVHAMEAKFSDAKSNDLLEADFTGAFSERNLAVTGRLTDRTLLGRGEFDRPYQKAKLITRSYARYLTGDDEPNDQQITEMIAAFRELETLAGDWLKSAEAKWSVKGSDKQDKTTQIKVVEANGMLKGARKAIFQLENRALLQDDKTKQLIDHLETAKESGDVEAYRSADTQLLAAVCGTLKPDNGTSDVLLIKDPSGDVAYAFKSVQGESDMMGTQKGFATAREVLMSKMCDGIKEQYGLDFPWPKATMAKVGGKTGALIDGVQGMKVPSDELQKHDVPAETLQKILLCNLAGGQFDIKWEDVRFVRNGDKLDATCMDGGAAMPDPDTATNFLAGLSDGKPGQQIIDNGDTQTGGFYPEALKPMSADLVAQFLSIKVKDLKADMDAQAKLLEKEHGLKVADLGLDSGIQSAMTSIEGIQKILNDAGGNITLAKFMEKFHADVVQKKFVEPKLAAWQQTQRAAYRQLLADHPGLFAPARDDEDVGELYRRALHPEVKARLRKLAALALPASIADMLRSYAVPVPINTAGDELEASVGKIQAAIANGLPAYDKERTKYPGLIVPKESFRTLAEAYIAVLHPSQSFALGQLKSLALKLSQDEGQTVTIAGLLQRYRFNVPTSDFKDKYNTIMADIKSKAKAT